MAGQEGNPLAYWLGGGSIKAIRNIGNRINPITEWFFGFNRADPHEFDANDEGLVRAYLGSLWAYRCIKTRGMRLAAIPLEVKTFDDQYVDRFGRLSDDPISNRARMHIVQRMVGPGSTRIWRNLEYDLCIWGRAFLLPTRKGLQRLNPTTVEIDKDPIDGIVGFRQFIGGRLTGEYEPNQLVYFYDYDPTDDLGGIPPLAFALRAIGAEVSVNDFVENFFANDATPGGLLTTDQPMSDSESQKAKLWWEKLFMGAENKGRLGIVGNGLHYEQVSQGLADMALETLRLEIRREITAAFGVPMTIALADEAANFATAQQQYIAFYTETVLPELDMVVDTLNEQLLPMVKGGENLQIVADISRITALQEDKNDLANRVFAGYTAGVYRLNEARLAVDLSPLDTDYFLVPNVGLVKAETIDKGDDMPALGLPKVTSDSAVAFEGEGETTKPDKGSGSGGDSGGNSTPSRWPGDGTLTDTDEQQQDARDNPSRIPPEKRAATESRFPIHPRMLDQESQYVVGRTQRPANSYAPDWRNTMRSAALDDLKRYRKKVLSKGIKATFESAAIPPSVRTFLEWDLADSDGSEASVKHAFDHAIAAVKSTDPTPEEFEAYWQGIGDIADELHDAVDTLIGSEGLKKRLTSELERLGYDVDAATQAAFMSEDVIEQWVDALVGTQDAPGPLTKVFLAGAARGQQLHDRLRRNNKPAPPLRATRVQVPVAWQLINQAAYNFAKEYAYGLVRGWNTTAMTDMREAMKDWINKGGGLPQLVDLVHGRLKGLDVPADWSPKKLDWSMSRDRARQIAQTESTRVFTEGNVARWKQLGIDRIKWRTQNDRIVCPACRSLNGQVAEIGKGFYLEPADQVKYKVVTILRPPLHPGCRCFPAPVTQDPDYPLDYVSPRVGRRLPPTNPDTIRIGDGKME